MAPAFLIMIVGGLLVALDDRRILIHRGNALGLARLFIEFGNPPDQAALHLLQGGYRLAGWKDEALLHFPGRTQLLQFGVVEAFQELPGGRRFGWGIA